MNKNMKKIGILLIICLLPVFSFAQGQPKDNVVCAENIFEKEKDQRKKPGRSENPRDKERQREQLVATKVAFFTAEIGLTPEEAQLFWPVYNEYWSAKSKLHKEVGKNLRDLKVLLERENVTAREVKEATEKYLNSCSKDSELEKEYYQKFQKILSSVKIGKMYVAGDKFRDKMIRSLREKK